MNIRFKHKKASEGGRETKGESFGRERKVRKNLTRLVFEVHNLVG